MNTYIGKTAGEYREQNEIPYLTTERIIDQLISGNTEKANEIAEKSNLWKLPKFTEYLGIRVDDSEMLPAQKQSAHSAIKLLESRHLQMEKELKELKKVGIVIGIAAAAVVLDYALGTN